MTRCSKWVNRKEEDINHELFKDYFSFQRPSNMLKTVYTTNNKTKNNKLVNVINSGLSDLKNEIKNMGETEKEIEKPNEATDVVEKVLELNKPNQSGQRLKILTPDQMLSRLPITLAQSRAGNNSKKLKNEIRKPLYSLYRSKNLQNNSIKAWLTLFKNRNNLYGHQK